MLKTHLCTELGIDVPIFSAGMGGGIAGPELVAAVSNAGGLGVLGMLGVPAPLIREQIRQTRALTTRPFGVNLVVPLLQGGEVNVVLQENVPVLVLFWGDPQPYVADAHRSGTRVIAQVGTVEEALTAAARGVDALMVQGVEAGGHVRSTTALSTLLPAVVAAVQPLPVIAAGGVADGRGLVAAISLGAQAVSMGTRFLCSEEARVDRSYKERIVRSKAADTVHTTLFDIGWPGAAHRVLRNKTTAEWEAAGSPRVGQRPGEGTVIGTVPMFGMTVEVYRYSTIPPLPGFEGDAEYAVLYCGESCELIDDVKPAGRIVDEVIREARRIAQNLSQ
jgi:NAD(P)H-dependent flavin oxidoreductase YrpB (nitropropane dioxygenase family)